MGIEAAARGVETERIVGALGLIATVKVELAALGKLEAGSTTFAVSVWLPSETRVSDD